MDNLTPYDKYASGDYLLHNIRIFLHAGAKVAIFPETAKHFPDFLCFIKHKDTKIQSICCCWKIQRAAKLLLTKSTKFFDLYVSFF